VSKNVAVFVDVANIFYAAKAAGVDIDYVTLLKSATAGRDFIRAYAYTGLDPENENQRQFQNFLARNGYKVVSKDIRKYGDGKVKANLDIELVVDLMKTARNVDIAVVVSGDGDFAPAIRAVQEMGVRVEVISFRGNTSSDLIEVADTFTDITQLAKVEKSGRSGRRVAASAEGDLSMTAVPDKETEGAPRRRGRRPAAAAAEAAATEAPAEAAPPSAARGRRSAAPAARAARSLPGAAARSAAEAIAAAGIPSLRVLPGERLSRAGTIPSDGEALPPDVALPDGLEPAMSDEAADEAVPSPAPSGGEATGEGELGEGRRRRRRRGGRGRGRGRAREREFTPQPEQGGEVPIEADAELEDAVPYPPIRPPQSTFGSIWDSQLGMNVPSRPAAELPAEPEEDLEEPEIPEYLLAERRRAGGAAGRGRGGRVRGGRGAYAAALDRERYGRSGGMSQPWSGDRGAGRPDRGPRGRRPMPSHGPTRPPGYERPPSAEPWSEVPPDLEEQIRAQLASAQGQQGSRPPERSEPAAQSAVEPAAPPAAAPSGAARRVRAAPRRRASAGSTPEAVQEAGPVAEGAAETAPRRRRAPASAAGTRTKRASTAATTRSGRGARSASTESGADASSAAEPPATEASGKAPKPRTRARRATADTGTDQEA